MELTRQSVEYGSGAPVPGMIPMGYGQQQFPTTQTQEATR